MEVLKEEGVKAMATAKIKGEVGVGVWLT